MVKGYNKSTIFDRISWILETNEVKKRPCVFLSHKKEDKPACRKIADYLSDANVDYYLDEDDFLLQQAAELGNTQEIINRIKKGISESSHMLVVISEKTYKSQWVPFEIGYGHSAIIDKSEIPDKYKLSILTLKNISEKTLPSFMKVGNILRGTKSLNNYICQISNKLEKSMINEVRLFSHSRSSHSLDDTLNWKL